MFIDKSRALVSLGHDFGGSQNGDHDVRGVDIFRPNIKTDNCPRFWAWCTTTSDAQPKSMNVEWQPYDFHDNEGRWAELTLN